MRARGREESGTEHRGWGKRVCLRTAQPGLAGMGEAREKGKEVRSGGQEGQPTTGLPSMSRRMGFILRAMGSHRRLFEQTSGPL